MKYLFLLYGDESQWADATPEQLQSSMDAYVALDKEVNESGVLVSGEGLEPSGSATTVSLRDGEAVLTDGPFAETREQLGGFYVLDCRDLDDAVAWAKKIPALREGGSIEIRPVMNYEAYGYEPSNESEKATN
jgi:hypothetical protein